MELAERVHYPVGRGGRDGGGGLVGPLPEALADLEAAHEAWQALGRPLDAARCELLLGQRLLEEDPQRAASVLAGAAAVYDELGVAHLAARARELLASDPARR